MRFLSIVKAAENQGPPPQALLDAIAKLTEDSLKDGSLVQTGGLSGTLTGARVRIAGGKLTVTDGTFMRLHQQHWPGWEGECEIRELCFLAP